MCFGKYEILLVVAQQCDNLTQSDAPENGGLVCHWHKKQNSQECGVRCNKGYEFPSRVNNYETCGPLTDYEWTFRKGNPDATIVACIRK